MTATLADHIAAAQALEQRGAWEGAVLAYEAALAEAPKLAEAHFNRANLLRRAGRQQDALAGYDRALALRPRWAAAHLNRGALLAEQGHQGSAIGAYRQATAIEPQNERAWGNLGNALSALGRHQEAIAALRTALRLAPESAVGLFNLGNALSAAGKPAEAAQSFMAALVRQPDMVEAAVNLSARLRQLGQPEAALQVAELAVSIAPALPQAQMAFGTAQYDLGHFDAAELGLRAALALHPGWALALANLGLVLMAQGRLDEALAAYDGAIALAPEEKQALFGRATCLLAMGDFAGGWPAFAARSRMPEADRRGFRQKLWRGEAAAERTLLIHAEQGLGDTLQFVRFAPLAAARSGARVILEVQPPLVRLLRGLPGIALVLPRGGKVPPYDLHVPMLDLPGLFTPELAAQNSYLAADPALVASNPLPPLAGRLRVGLVWAGQSRPDQPHAFAMDRRRSLKLRDFASLAPLCRDGAISLVSLQHGKPAEQLQAAPPGLEIIDGLAGISDFAETAAIVAQLDLVIAVDTSTAHLAAAMGRQVWLLSRFDACWRWLHGRSDSPWYPTLTVFRQDRPNDWRGPIEAICNRLCQTS